MKVLVQGHTLAVGLNGKSEILRELPIELTSVDTASQAVSFLKLERFDGVITRWRLDDASEGDFLKKLRLVRPDTPAVVLVDSGNPAQEIMARSIGVSAVLTENCSDELLLATVAAVLGIDIPDAVHAENARTAKKTIMKM
ncbi:MAG: response regulator [Phycisphaerae bacterium]